MRADAKEAESSSIAGAPISAPRSHWSWALAGSVVAAAVTSVVLVTSRSAPPLPDLVRLEIPPPADEGWGTSPRVAVSPDGRQLLITVGDGAGGASPLYVRSLDSASAQPIPGTQGARAPFWSPDLRHAGFFTRDQLKVVTLATGTVQIVCEAQGLRVFGTWGPSVILFSEDPGRPISKVSPAGGAPAPVIQAAQTGVGRPRFLPDGRRFLYQAGLTSVMLDGNRVAIDRNGDIWLLDARGQERQVTTTPASDSSPLWSVDEVS